MQFDFTLIGIALATMFFGYFFGLFEGRGQGYKRRRKEEVEEIHPIPSAVPAEPVVKDDPGILRLRQGDRNLLLDLDGSRVDTNALSADQRKRLIALLTLMRPWLEGQTAVSYKQSAIPLQGLRSGQQPAIPLQGLRSGQQPSVSSQQPVSKPQAEEMEEEKPAPSLSIVGQIDAILQSRLASTLLATKGIRLQDSPEGGVIVWVGIHKYATVDDVPDLETKAAIRAAIKEWEEKFTPGG